jgi:hypothetical protein
MAKKGIEKKVADYFKSNLSRAKVFATSDNFLFERKENAKTHAKSLKDSKVEEYRKSVEFEQASSTEAQKKAEEAKKQEEAAKKAATNSAGQPKNPATTGADQKTAK